MTLTTERQQFEQWWETAMHNGYPPRFGWEHWRDGDGYRDDDGEFQGLWQAWQASRELLANREAQPVKNTVLLEHSGCGYGVQTDMITVKLNRGDVVVQIPGNIKKVINEKGQQSAVIYTAPPAPAVNSVPDFEAWFVEKYKQPERLMKNGDGAYKFSGVQMAFFAWIDGRAAMLAQPVSSGYKLVPVEPTENMIIDGFESDAFMALADAVNEKNSWPYGCRESAECVEGIFKAMLAAAPEGGNG